MESFVIPNDCNTIEDHAFSGCVNLTKVSISGDWDVGDVHLSEQELSDTLLAAKYLTDKYVDKVWKRDI